MHLQYILSRLSNREKEILSKNGPWRIIQKPCFGSGDQLRSSIRIRYKLLVSKTVGRMIVDHADGLHEGVADGRPDKIEAEFFQVFAHSF